MKETMTVAEAKAAGLLDAKPQRSTKRAAPRGGSWSRCCTCGEIFTGETSERRHSDDNGHHRFEMVLEGVP